MEKYKLTANVRTIVEVTVEANSILGIVDILDQKEILNGKCIDYEWEIFMIEKDSE